MTAKRILLVAGVLVAFAGSGATQQPEPLSFEVASVKRNDSSDPGRQGALFRDQINTSTGRVTLRNVTLKTCIKWAYSLQEPQIAGPGWLAEDRYDIASKASGPASEDQLRRMLRTMLSERFKLVVHTEQRTSSAAILTIGSKPPNLHESETEGPGSIQMRAGRLVAHRTTMGELAAALSDPLRLPVVDATGLPGRYDFTLDFSSFVPRDGQTPDEMSATISVVRQQLGLELQSRKVPVEILVVDSANKAPVEN